ncbi:MAG: PIN domain-containing protein [Rhodomicrobium sp.]
MIVTSFLDTNILLYLASRNPADVQKKAIAARIVSREKIGISAQVMQEFYTVAIRKADFRLTPAEGLEWLEKLEEFPCVPVTPSLVKNAVLHSIRHRISYWDGAILAAAEALGAPVLYTEDLNHGQAYGTVAAINPFLDLPAQPGFHENVQTALAKD